MRAKEQKMSWYFDIVNPILAEICRKYKIKVYTSGNMVHSKGNMPYSTGSAWVKEPRLVESHTGRGPSNPSGGSIAYWFAEMAKNAKLADAKTCGIILDLASEIDGYTYFYEIEQVNVAPDSYDSFIAIEKRLWNEVVQYGFTESEFEDYRKELRKNSVPSELRFLICDDSEKEPLCERLNEGLGMRNPNDISRCMLTTEFFSPYDQYTNDGLRKIMEEKGGKNCAVSRKCTIPFIESSDKMSTGISGTNFSLTSISGKSKTVVTDLIKRNGGKVVAEYNPKTTVFIAKNISEKEFIEENAKEIKYIYRIVTNPLLSGLARKTLGEKVCVILEKDFQDCVAKQER